MAKVPHSKTLYEQGWKPEPEKPDSELTPAEAAERAKRRYEVTMAKRAERGEPRKNVPFSDPELWGLK